MRQDTRQKSSRINGISFPFLFSNNATFVHQQNLRGISLLKFRTKVTIEAVRSGFRLLRTLSTKVCYYGPFKGEFGHMLAHTLPFLMYLHKKGVRIFYCGMELHRPLLVDESGKSVVHEFIPLRDFFPEVPPSSNSVVPPKDVQEKIRQFTDEAKRSGKPFWNIGDNFYYWFIHRHIIGSRLTHVYNLSKVYKTKDENTVCVFPRSKGAAATYNNGEAWDYSNLINLIKPFFDKVYVLGHPSQSLNIEASENVEVHITADNKKILEACANSRLIITQHSGVNNLGEYLHKQVLIIYKGGTKVSDIGSINNTLLFRKYMKERIPLKFAFSEDEILMCLSEMNKNG